MNVFRIISIVSVLLYGGTLLYCLPRLVTALRVHSKWSHSLLIQASLAMFTLCEVVNAGSFYVEASYNTWGFVFYLIGQFFFVIALTTFSRMWSRFTLFRSSSMTGGKLLGAGKAIVAVNFLSSVVAIGVTMTENRFEDVRHRFRGVLLTHFIIVALSLSALAGRMLSYGIDVYNRLKLARAEVPAQDKDLRLSAIRRVNTVVGVLTLCFLVRLVSMFILIYDLATGDVSADSVPFILWFIFFNWIPTILPGWMLLFITYRSQSNELRSSMLHASVDDSRYRSPNGSSYRPPFSPHEDYDASRSLLSGSGDRSQHTSQRSDDGSEDGNYRTLADIGSSRIGGHLLHSVDGTSDTGSAAYDDIPATDGRYIGMAMASSQSTDISIGSGHPSGLKAVPSIVPPGSSSSSMDGYGIPILETNSSSIPGSFRDDNPGNYRDAIEKYIIMK